MTLVDVPNYNFVPYLSTNESIESIIVGLDPQPSDRILAVCGAGDQAFALLEYAGSVLAVDKDQRQINYAKKRLDSLLRGDYGSFANPESSLLLRTLKNTFCDNEKLKELRKKVSDQRITLLVGDLFSMTDQLFDKAYLSNATTYSLDYNSHPALRLERVAQMIVPGGLVYLSDDKKGHVYSERLGLEFIPKNLALDKKLTAAARRTNNEGLWTPGVYRKVAEVKV